MKKIPISIIGGIVAIIVTTIMYFAICGNIFTRVICLVTYLGVIIAEAVTTALAYRSKGDPRKVAATIVFSLAIPAALLLSVIYIVNFPYGYGSYVSWYFVVSLLLGLVSFVLWVFTAKKTAENETLQDAKTNMINLRKIVKCIMADPAAAEYLKDLSQIEDKLHFSDDSVISEKDAEICEMLYDLQEGISDESYDVKKQIAAINKKIDIRNIMAKKTV